MKKTTPIFLFHLFFPCFLFAQNWSGVHSNQPNIYDNGQTMFIASIDTVAGNPVYRFCQDVATSSYCSMQSPTSPSYFFAKKLRLLGSNFIRFTNGDEVYQNTLFENITIKNLAELNDTWLMMTDTNGIEYHATIVDKYDTTIFGLDSVKQIAVQANYGGNAIVSPYNIKIKLSMNHGFIEIFPLANFPYETNIIVSNFLYHTEPQHQARKVYPSKYDAGNEWMSSLIYDTNGVFYVQYQHDSIIASSYNSLTTEISYTSQRKIIIQASNLLTTISASNQLILDTIQLSNYYQNSFLINNPIFHWEYEKCIQGFSYATAPGSYSSYIDCNSDTLERFYNEKFGVCNLSLNSPTDSCIQLACPLGNSDYNVSVLTLEGFGILNSYVNDIDAFSYRFDTYYYKLNGCTSGNKFAFNFPAKSDLFQLSLQQQTNHTTNVNWFTINEKNVHHFDIERSYDGVHFASIGAQITKGDNLERNEYRFVENQFVKKGKVFYRIKMTDIDDKTSYSNTEYVSLSSQENTEIGAICKKESLELTNLNPDDRYEAMLTNIYGQKLVILQNFGGNQSQTIAVKNLSEGMYFLTIQSALAQRKQIFRFMLHH
jgi:hypothetical protein